MDTLYKVLAKLVHACMPFRDEADAAAAPGGNGVMAFGLVTLASGRRGKGDAVSAYAEVAATFIFFSIFIISSISLSGDIYNPRIYFGTC